MPDLEKIDGKYVDVLTPEEKGEFLRELVEYCDGELHVSKASLDFVMLKLAAVMASKLHCERNLDRVARSLGKSTMELLNTCDSALKSETKVDL